MSTWNLSKFVITTNVKRYGLSSPLICLSCYFDGTLMIKNCLVMYFKRISYLARHVLDGWQSFSKIYCILLSSNRVVSISSSESRTGSGFSLSAVAGMFSSTHRKGSSSAFAPNHQVYSHTQVKKWRPYFNILNFWKGKRTISCPLPSRTCRVPELL